MPALPAKVDGEADEACPVCKQSRYLNPKMTFKINPECYHRMCDSCIDRIFMAGPAPCPVAGCSKTLRRARFRKQTFDDLAIERECDIRRYVNDILNKREADFESLRDYNDYLQKKEDLTWNLVGGVDVDATRRQLADFQRQNRHEIEANRALDRAEREGVEAAEDTRRRRAREALEDSRRELAEERSARDRENRNMVGALLSASSGDAEEVVRRARERVVLKKSSAARSHRAEVPRKDDAPTQQQQQQQQHKTTGDGGGSGLSFAGLKKVEVKEPAGPYDPFGGLRLESKYYSLRDGGNYAHFYDKYRSEKPIVAGGYDVRDYYTRALHEAHAGLGIILGREKVDDAAAAPHPATTTAAGAS